MRLAGISMPITTGKVVVYSTLPSHDPDLVGRLFANPNEFEAVAKPPQGSSDDRISMIIGHGSLPDTHWVTPLTFS